MSALTEWQRIERLLDELLVLSEPERALALARIAHDDRALHDELASLLAHVGGEDVLLDAPAVDLVTGYDERIRVLASGDRIGPYRLLRELGRGGMGVVWLAERDDGLFKRPVALKLPAVALSRHTLAERFARERAILAPLNHPNIARLHDAGFADDGQPYLALEYVEGEPITRSCDAAGADVRRRIDLFLQALAAVEYAHRNLVLHRDLKPSNILVTPDGTVKLLDFGIAKLMDDGTTVATELTRLGGHALTLDYASPEQALGMPLTTAADIYSLGVVLYELLAGQRPYRLKRGTRGELEEAITAADPSPPSRVAGADAARTRGTPLARLKRGLAGDLDTIVLKALHKSPDQRYASAAALADDLRRHLASVPILARPASGWYRAARFVRRHAVPVTAAAIVALALIASSIVSWLLMERAERAAVEARKEARIATAVQTFVTDLFRTNSSDQRYDKQVRDMTAAELLARGALSIDKSLDDAPAAKASLLELFGEMYEELGLLEQSAGMHGKSVDAAAGAFGKESREYALALLEKAWVTGQFDKTTDAPRRMVEEAKQVLARLAPVSEDYAEALYMEASVFALSDPARAVASAEESVRLMDRVGATGKRAAFARQELAYAYRLQGNLGAAAVATNDAIRRFESLFGEDHQNVSYLHLTLAIIQMQRMHLAEAEGEFRKAIDIQEKYPFFRRTVAREYRLQLAQLIAFRGRYEEAYAQMDELESASRNAPDRGGLVAAHVPVLRALARIGHGDKDGALAELDAASRDTSSFGPRAVVSTSLLNEYLARAHLLAGDVPAARLAVDRALEIVAKEGTVPVRRLWLSLRDAELQALEGHSDRAVETVDRAQRAFGVGGSAPDARANVALTQARIGLAAGNGASVLTSLAPYLDQALEPGFELPAAMRAEMLLLSGEALALTGSSDARRRLQEAEVALRGNDVATSPRLLRAEAAVARVASR